MHVTHRQGWLALSPMIVFFCLYLITSLVLNDFYSVPITVAFIVASVYAVAITRGMSLTARIQQFTHGAANTNILYMIWIFILAGAFAVSAKEIGAIDATVALVLNLLPDRLLPAGIFIGACFVSLSVGTSVGTIVALTPVVSGIAAATGLPVALLTAIVVGGAFFGDNLSFISDTTIAATRTQGCAMRDKFRTNLRIVLPAAILVLAFYLFYGYGETQAAAVVDTDVDYIRIIPYIVVLCTALAGLNVLLVLVLGLLTVGIVGIGGGATDILGWFGSMGTGVTGMGELIIITLLAGGMLELIRYNGGIDYILAALTRRVNSRRGAELSIAALVSMANVCTANNTIAIITVGPIAADISRRFSVDPRRSASIVDTFSCVIQGIIPYGAQLLMAAKLAGISPISITGYLYYPMAVCIFALAAIFIGRKH